MALNFHFFRLYNFVCVFIYICYSCIGRIISYQMICLIIDLNYIFLRIFGKALYFQNIIRVFKVKHISFPLFSFYSFLYQPIVM